ncbi:MAG: hypothetical protein ACI4EX_11795 [Lachnospiraceae bacterium]
MDEYMEGVPACFFTLPKYNSRFRKLFNQSKIGLIMICNDIVLRMEHISSLYQLYCNLRKEYDAYSFDKKAEYSMFSQDFIIVEEIIYHSRKAIDQMIYALWANKVGWSMIDESNEPVVDCIVKYLKPPKGQTISLREFDSKRDFLGRLNTLSNSYKHSIGMFSHLSTDLSHSKETPSFFSYAVKMRDRESEINENIPKEMSEIFECFLESICN